MHPADLDHRYQVEKKLRYLWFRQSSLDKSCIPRKHLVNHFRTFSIRLMSLRYAGHHVIESNMNLGKT